jgi:NAD-dependent dihydropyrimidine dehydrogenase PreA subunit/flavodoxin
VIFYFSATGNSLYAARKLADATDDRLVSIGEALRGGVREFNLRNERRLGFVVPVFAWTLPGAVARFIQGARFTGFSGEYVYAVFTCGASSGGETSALTKLLQDKGLRFDGSFDLVMPDNFIFWTPLPSESALSGILDGADLALEKIINSVCLLEPGHTDASPPREIAMPIARISSAGGTSKFYATDACNSCGMCEIVCPMRCIAIDAQDKPRWEGECTQCLACLHRCPRAAVEHGGDAVGKRRYCNPRVGSFSA